MMWYQYPALLDRNRLIQLLKEGLTYGQIASRIGASRYSVMRAIRTHGLEKRPIVLSIPDDLKKRLRL